MALFEACDDYKTYYKNYDPKYYDSYNPAYHENYDVMSGPSLER